MSKNLPRGKYRWSIENRKHMRPKEHFLVTTPRRLRTIGVLKVSLIFQKQSWLAETRDEDDLEETARMKRLREKAEKDKAQEHSVDVSYLEDEQQLFFNEDESQFNHQADIDPLLRNGAPPSPQHGTNGSRQTYEAPINEEPNYFANANHYQPYGTMDAHHDLDDEFPSQLLALAEQLNIHPGYWRL